MTDEAVTEEEILPLPHWPDYPAWRRWTDGQCERLRYEYDLNRDSVVLDLGAFYGDWAKTISDKFDGPFVYCFEPIESIADIAAANIVDYPNIKLLRYAVGKNNEELEITFGPAEGVSSSFYIADEGQKLKVPVRAVKEVFEELLLTSVDLMKINIEGSEYDVLESMVEHNLHTRVKNIQVQFHRLGEDYQGRYDRLREKLQQTHELTYEYTYIWENWKLK